MPIIMYVECVKFQLFCIEKKKISKFIMIQFLKQINANILLINYKINYKINIITVFLL